MKTGIIFFVAFLISFITLADTLNPNRLTTGIVAGKWSVILKGEKDAHGNTIVVYVLPHDTERMAVNRMIASAVDNEKMISIDGDEIKIAEDKIKPSYVELRGKLDACERNQAWNEPGAKKPH